jgi:hypothetical protein
VSYWSLAYSLVGDIVDVLSGNAADVGGKVVTTLYLISKCSSAVDYSSLSIHNPLSIVTFGSALTCAISEAASNLASPDKAYAAARSLLGPGIDQAKLATATRELTDIGGKLLTFGWVVQLWPVLQLGWGGTADVVASLLTGGTSTLINLDLIAGPGGGQIVYFRCCGIPVSVQNSRDSSFNLYRSQTLAFDATGAHIIDNAKWQVWNSTEAIAQGYPHSSFGWSWTLTARWLRPRRSASWPDAYLSVRLAEAIPV